MKNQTPLKKTKSKKSASKPKSARKVPVKKPNKVVKGEVNLTPPWASGVSQSMKIEGGFTKSLDKFVAKRSSVYGSYIREAEKTKRLWLILSVFLLAFGLLIILFAPQGRETLSYWIGGALIIFSAGAAGYKRVWGKTKFFSAGADQDRQNIDQQQE